MHKALTDSPDDVIVTERDRELLYAMDFDARISSAELGDRLGMAASEVDARIHQLIRGGVVKGFHPVLNVPKLGYLYGRLLITLRGCTKEDEEDITDFLINHPNVFWMFRMQGTYDLLIVTWVETVTEFVAFTRGLERKFGRFIKRKLETILTDVTYLKNRYLTGALEDTEIHLIETRDHQTLDPLERRILQLLSVNARFTDAELALNLHGDKTEIRQRISRLEQSGIILGYRPLLDHVLLGYTWYKVWLNVNKASEQALAALIGDIKRSPIALYVDEGVGLSADVEIEVMVSSNSELYAFINDLRFRYPTAIEDYSTVAFLEALKELYLPFH